MALSMYWSCGTLTYPDSVPNTVNGTPEVWLSMTLTVTDVDDVFCPIIDALTSSPAPVVVWLIAIMRQLLFGPTVCDPPLGVIPDPSVTSPEERFQISHSKPSPRNAPGREISDGWLATSFFPLWAA